MIVLIILGCILLLLFLVLMLLIFVPFEYAAEGEKYESYYVLAHISWMFGGLRIYYKKSAEVSETRVKILGIDLKRHPSKDSEQTNEGKEKKEKRKKPRVNYFKKELIKKSIKAIGELINHLKPKKFYVTGVFGFDEPYDTSILWLIILALPLHHKNFDINLQPNFCDEILEGRFIIEGRIVLAAILWIAVKFRLSRPVKNILKERKRKAYAN